MEATTKQILDELKAIRSDLTLLKRHVVDLDLVLTDADLRALEAAEHDLHTGKTKRLV